MQTHGTLSVELPAGWNDATMVSFHEPPSGEFTHSLTIAREALAQGLSLEAYTETQLAELGRELSQFEVVRRTRLRFRSGEGPRTETRWRGLDGRLLLQVQYFIPGRGEVIVVTGTASEETFVQYLPLFDRVAGSVRTAG